MIKVSDYIFKRIAQTGVRHVFMLTGGGAMHLNDSLGRNRDLQYICNHHEQACAMGADAYARIRGTLGVACVTTGPGGTNALTGVLGQWLDSIPALYLSGQVRTEVTISGLGLPLRQIGDQEADIVAIAKSITKYAVMVTDPRSIRYHLDRALHLARSGRPGPVWLDIPLDVQAAMVSESELRPYDPAEDAEVMIPGRIENQTAEALKRLRDARRPVILAGSGIRIAGAYERFHSLLKKLRVPILSAWNAMDVIPTGHPLAMGRQGPLGQRAANFIFQNADLLLSIGCRMSVARQLGYEFSSVARAAYKIMINIDPVELEKKVFKPDLPICCDAGLFLEEMERQVGPESLEAPPEWVSWCRTRRDRYPSVLPEYRQLRERVNPYVFCEVLGACLAEDDVVVSSNGASCVVPIQALPVRNGQRYIVNSGCAAMGFGLPAAIGASFARDRGRVICLEGDGSIQLNIQELQTVVHHRLPVKIFVFNNDGYLSIRTTQGNFFESRFVGEGPRSGVTFPDILKIAGAYGIEGLRISRHEGMEGMIRRALAHPGPILCDVHMSSDQTFTPRMSSQRMPDGRMVSKPLEDMYPFLEEEEFLSNMLIPPWKGSR